MWVRFAQKNENPVWHPAGRSLRMSLLGWFLGIALVPLAVVGAIGYQRAKTAQLRDLGCHLEAAAASQAASLQELLARGGRELDYLRQLPANARFANLLRQDQSDSGQAARVWASSRHWDQLTALPGGDLRDYRQAGRWRDILILDPGGRLLFSCERRDDLGSDILAGPFAHTNLADAVALALSERRMVLSEFARYDPAGSTVAFLVAPIIGQDATSPALMALMIDVRDLAAMVGRHLNLGPGETVYLVDENLRLLGRSVPVGLANEPDRQVTSELATAWLERVQAAAALAAPMSPLASAGRSGVSAVGLDGRTVFGRFATVGFLGRAFGIVVEVDRAAALAGVDRIRLTMLASGLLTALLVGLLGTLISRRVVQPILALGSVMRRVADGHEIRELPPGGHDEIGGLTDQFATMLQHLREAKQGRDHQYRLQRAQFELNERMRDEKDPTALAQAILEYIGDYYRAAVGAFYLTRPGQRLVLAAHYGGGGGNWPRRELREGQGIVGRAAQRRRVHVLNDIPADHVRLRTATGESSPRTVIVAPFHFAGRIKGVMELGTAEVLAESDLEFLSLVAESVAVALDSARSRDRVQRLLEETRRQAGTLARQQKELQDSNEQLARSDRYKSEFLANMSHELRTPLNSMMLLSQLLTENRRGHLDAEEVETAQTIKQAGDELLTIINDILDLSKVEAGKLELTPEEVDLGALVNDLQHLFQPVCDGKGLELRAHLGPGLPATVFTDGLRLRQILKNLLNNACKFTEHGSVVLRVRVPSPSELLGRPECSAETCVAFSVSDTGIGMSDEVRALVFEPFNQGDGTIGRRYGGSGLGLSISRRLTEMLKGRLEVASVAGKGTKFTLYLPLKPIFDTDADADVHSNNATSERRRRRSAPPAVQLPAAGGNGRPRGRAAGTAMAATGDQEPRSQRTTLSGPEMSWLTGCRLVLADDEMRTVYRLGDELRALGMRLEIKRTVPELWQHAADPAGRTILLVNPWCASEAADSPRGADLVSRLRARLDSTAAGRESLLLVLAPAGAADNFPGADAVLTKPVELDCLLTTCSRLLSRQEVPS